MFISQRILGSIISGAGGLVALFALLLLPYVTKIDFSNTNLALPSPFLPGPVHAFTLPGIQFTAQPAMGGGWGALLMTLLAIAAIVFAGMQLLGRGTNDRPIARRATKALILLGSLALVSLFLSYLASLPPHVAYYSFVQQTDSYANGAKTSGGESGNAPAYYYDPGFWLYIVGMVLIIVGNVVSALSEQHLQLGQERSI